MQFTTGIDPNTLNDFTRTASPSAGQLGQDSVQLFIYSPKPMPYQVLRSHMYQFTPNFMDAISDKKNPSFEYAVGLQNAPNIPDINKVILPDAEGKMVDLSNWNNLWTFTLILDLQQAQYAGIRSPSTRKIASGYFYNCEEAGTIDAFGNFIPNPNAIMIFTHVTDLQVRQKAGPTSAPDGLFVSPSTHDYAGESVPIFYNQDMYLGTPSELLKSVATQSDTGFADYSGMLLSNVKDGQGMRTIDNDLKSPKCQLSRIMRAIDRGIETTEVNNPVYDRMSSNDDFVDPITRSINTMVNSCPSSTFPNLTRGLDTTRPISVRELIDQYPNILIVPSLLRQDNNYGWNVASQIGQAPSGQVGPIVSPKQQFSALAASSIQAICAALGIATVAFSYRWLDSDGFMVGKSEAFQLANFGLMIPRSDAITEQIVHRMKMYLDDQLFNVIHDNVGEFELNCMCDMASTILVGLCLYQFPDAQDGAYYQTDCRLGGIVNPLVGTQDVIVTNANQLYSTAHNLATNTLASINLTPNIGNIYGANYA